MTLEKSSKEIGSKTLLGSFFILVGSFINTRGLGCRIKKSKVRDIILSNFLDFVKFDKTKISEVFDSLVKFLRWSYFCEWSFSPFMCVIVVVYYRFGVVRRVNPSSLSQVLDSSSKYTHKKKKKNISSKFLSNTLRASFVTWIIPHNFINGNQQQPLAKEWN